MLWRFLLAWVITATVPGLALAAQQGATPNQSPAPRFAISPAMPQSNGNSNGSAELGRQSARQSPAARLSRSNGTIQPPAMDRGMVKPPPATGSAMPVLQPPPNVSSK